MSEAIEQLKQLIDEAKTIVILTGAGISTESGVPDFRSPGGLWEQFRIVEYGEYTTSEEARIEDWHRRFFMADQIGQVEPNIGHTKIADWINSGNCTCLVTQNVDGLHLRGGAPQDKIIEIHGNATTASCISCGEHHPIELCRTLFEATGESPKCQSCDGLVKADIVMFGEKMPVKKTAEAFKISETADLFIAIGTSLVVNPAAGLPLHAKHNDAKFAILNRDPTELDRFADCVVNAEIGEVMKKL
jgi:NAD-dependent deacetylase